LKQSTIDALSVPAFLVMVAGILLLYFNRVSLMVWARVTFGGRSFHASAKPTDGGLVTSGPYRYMRHPIYAAALLFAWAGIFGNPSILNALFGVLLFAGAFGRILCEEHLVRTRYPEYEQYADKTKRLIPFVF
jgi:protein-S-isoprenylcysteine O-methyltransferase Ste14